MDRAQGLVQEMKHRNGVSVFAAMAAGLAALVLGSEAEATEVHIRSFFFECETPDGRIVKPRHGDIVGMTYSNLPAQRAQCLGTIDRKIALCRENTEFATDAENEEFAACLAVFRERARDCVGHFSFERSKCGADEPDPDADVAIEQEDGPTMEGPPGDRYSLKPADRMMTAREAANVRTGPSPDYDIVGTVMGGDRLRVTGELRGRDWLRVEYPRSGDVAFIYGPLLRADPSTSVTPAESTASPPPPEQTTSRQTASRRTDGPDWSILENKSCQVWNYGNRDYEPFTWSGTCVDGKVSGNGRLVLRGGEGTYDGDMLAGRMHGRGVLNWANGFRYEGELREGKQHGYGSFTQATGERYVGEWRNGRPHGQGTYTQIDGTAFEGTWEDGCLEARDGRWASIGTTAEACGFE